MEKYDINKVKNKKNPLFKGFPSRLKDVAIFDEVETQLQTILKTDHHHKTATAYSKCAECDAKRVERREAMKKLGFKSIQQYLEWKKIMLIIKNKKNFRIA